MDPKPDKILGIESHYFDTELRAQSSAFDFDMGKTVHLNKSRWSRLIREYFPNKPWKLFRSQAWEIIDGDARPGATTQMMFREPERFAKKHRWGGCLIGCTFRERVGEGWHLTFYSRTTYLG